MSFTEGRLAPYCGAPALGLLKRPRMVRGITPLGLMKRGDQTLVVALGQPDLPRQIGQVRRTGIDMTTPIVVRWLNLWGPVRISSYPISPPIIVGTDQGRSTVSARAAT